MKKHFIVKFVIFIIIIRFISINPAVAATSTPTVTVTTTPSASPSVVPEDEKVNEIRQAIKDKLTEIKNKIEKRAYVGQITEITDSLITISNFRGKQRLRIFPETIIIGVNKKEIKSNELEIDGKIIGMGDLGENDILHSKRIVVVSPPKTIPPKKLAIWGIINTIDLKNSSLNISSLIDKDRELILKTDTASLIYLISDQKSQIKLKNLKENQKIIVVYYEPSSEKTPVVKTIFGF